MEIGTRVRILIGVAEGWPKAGELGTVTEQKGFSAIEVTPDKPCALQTPDDKSFPYTRREIERLGSIEESLRIALKLYGRHLDGCGANFNKLTQPCSCGLTAASEGRG